MGTWFELIGQYGYIAIVIIFTLGIVGLPIPDEILITYLGYVVSIGKLDLILTFVSAFFGTVCGITISYFLGVKLGEPFLRRYGSKFFITEKTINRTNALFNKYGSFVLFICYFIPGVRHVAAYIGGITRFSFKRFALFAYTGAFLWVMTFITLGYRLGSNWKLVAAFFRRYMWVMIPLVVVAIVVIIYYTYRSKKDSHLS